MQTEINESILKQVIKEALLEMLDEKRNVFQDIIVEAIEDIALCHAVDEGRDSGNANKQEILNILNGH